MAFPSGRFYQRMKIDGVTKDWDLADICESDKCDNLKTLNQYKNNLSFIDIPDSTNISKLDCSTTFYQNSNPIKFPLIGCCTVPQKADIKTQMYTRDDNIYEIDIKRNSNNFTLTYKYVDGNFVTDTYLSKDFYRGVIPRVIGLEVEAGGGSGANGGNEGGMKAGGGGGAGGYCVLCIDMKETSGVVISLDEGGASPEGNDHESGNAGGNVRIAGIGGTLLINGGSGGTASAGGVGGGVFIEESSGSLVNIVENPGATKNLTYALVCKGYLGGDGKEPGESGDSPGSINTPLLNRSYRISGALGGSAGSGDFEGAGGGGGGGGFFANISIGGNGGAQTVSGFVGVQVLAAEVAVLAVLVQVPFQLEVVEVLQQ